MNNYNDFEVKDWLENRGFQNWVYLGEADFYWLSFIESAPGQAANMEQARNILLSVRGDSESISQKEVKLRVAEILKLIPQEVNIERAWWKNGWLQVASVLLLIGLGIGSAFIKSLFSQPEPYYTMIRQHGKDELIEITNTNDEVKMVNLPDGSSVLLKKNARIAYPRKFADDKREVYMLGEVFFEVSKNPKQPFFVYSAEMVTKVSGTSFSIRANESDEELDLVVKSGVVEVSAFGKSKRSDAAFEQTLNPNQRITLNRTDRTMSTKTMQNAVLLNLPVESENFSFKRTPLVEVFSLLEKSYGLTIVFDKVKTAGCSITAHLGDEPLYEKLAVICAVLNARFHARGSDVKVVTNGCATSDKI